MNGFGRIGRLLLRHIMRMRPRVLGDDDTRVMAINDPRMTLAQAAYLFQFDSVHGVWPGTGECPVVAVAHSSRLMQLRRI